MYNVQFIYVSIICRMLDAYTDKSHLDVTWVSQSLYSGPLSNPVFFLSLIADRIIQVVLYMKIIIIIIIIKTLFQEGNTISTKLISLAALKYLQIHK